MARVYDQGAFYGVTLNEDEIDIFRSRWPGSELGGLRNLYCQFDRDSGDLVDVECNNRRCDKFDGHELSSLVQDAQCLAEHRMGIDTMRGCSERHDWKQLLPEKKIQLHGQKHTRKRTK